MADGFDERELRPIDPKPILELLLEHDVDFVVIGGLAGIAHGSAFPTYDVDIMCERALQNLERLAAALKDLGASLRGAPDDLPLQLDGKMLRNGTTFTFNTEEGSFDVLMEPSGAPPYEKLRDNAKTVEAWGLRVPVASLNHLIAMKRAAGRDKDVRALTEYIALAEEAKRQGLDE